MRNAAVMFANTLLAIVAALLIYHYAIDREGREQMVAKMHEDSEATNRELERIAKAQSGIRDVLAKLPDAAGAGNETSADMRGDFVAAAGSVKTAIAEYYQTNGKLPASNHEVQLPEPDQYRGKSMRSATVTPEGSVDFVFDATSGVDGGRIRLTPDLAHANAMGLQWRCVSADFPQIARVLPVCEYKPAAASTATAVTAPESAK